MRSPLAEFGIVVAKGIQHSLRLAEHLVEGVEPDIPALAVQVIVSLAEQLRALQVRVADLEKDLKNWSRDNEAVRRLKTIPGVGANTASALNASVTDPHQFTSGRQFTASLGLTPRATSSGVRSAWGASPRWATAISGVCW